MSSQKAFINTMLFYHWDNSLFNGMTIPESVNRDILVRKVLRDTSDFPVIYTDLEVLRMSINDWSVMRCPIWKHLIDTTHYTYNPIENYDRHETETNTLHKTGEGTVKGDGGSDETTRTTRNSIEDNTTHSGTDKTTNSGSDITSKTYENETSNSGTDRTVTDNDRTDTNSGTDTTTLGGTDNVDLSSRDYLTKRGNDVETESVSAFNESGFVNHTQTDTEYHTDDERLITSSEDTNYGKTETKDYGLVTSVEDDTTQTTTYGKTENASGEESETITHGKVETLLHGLQIESEKEESGFYNEITTHSIGNVETRDFTDSFQKEVYIHGNIGVTTTQEMIKQEREIADFDIYKFIVEDYKKEFCIMVY